MITVDEVIRRSEQGVSRPFLCKCDDGHLYYVKGRGTGYQTLVKEIVSAALGHAFELPVPHYAVIQIPSELVTGSSFPEIYDLGIGPAFGSRAVTMPEEFSDGHIAEVPPNLRSRLFIFDWWIMNGDRTLVEGAGNPNLLWTPLDNKMHVIDHTCAFDPEFNLRDFLQGHVFRKDRINTLNNEFRLKTEGVMRDILETISSIWAKIPGEWTNSDVFLNPASMLDENRIRTILSRFKKPDFWNILNS